MKKILLAAVAIAATATSAFADEPEKYSACSMVDGKPVAAEAFANATVADGQSHITFGTANMTVDAVAGTTPVDVKVEANAPFPGWTAGWKDVKWDPKNSKMTGRDENFSYIQGTGNPYTKLEAEYKEGGEGSSYVGKYTYYLADGSNGMPISGLYYKFQPKADGKLKVKIWANKGSRNTFVVDGETMKAIAYEAEGYMANVKETVDGVEQVKYLSNAEIQENHKTNTGYFTDGVDQKPYVIGNGQNQAFFGYVLFNVTKGKEYWLLQDSSQIGFGGYEFTVGSTDGIADVPAAQPQAKAGRTCNIAGQIVGPDYRGIVIRDGKKHIQK